VRTVGSRIPFDILAPASETPTTSMTATTVGGFNSAVLTFDQEVNAFATADANIQVQKGGATWYDCAGFIPGTGFTVIGGFDGPSVDPTAVRIIGTPTALTPTADPILFPQELPIPFP
jgi:hypothetical protein